MSKNIEKEFRARDEKLINELFGTGELKTGPLRRVLFLAATRLRVLVLENEILKRRLRGKK